MSALFLTPLVIAQRLPQLWFEALHPNPLVKEESRLAVTEKITAFSEGLMAAHAVAVGAQMKMASAMMSGRSPVFAALAAPKSIAAASMAPIEKRLKHNMKRLSKPVRQRSHSTNR